MPRQNTSPADYPQAVLQQIEQLAHNIAIARKRRGETQAQWAKKLGVSQPTFARIERGDPGVSMASYMMCMWLIDPEVGLADLVSPLNDRAALEREVSKVSKTRKLPKSANARMSSAAFDPRQQSAMAVREPPSARGPYGPSGVSEPPPGTQKGVARATRESNATAQGLAALMLKNPANKP